MNITLDAAKIREAAETSREAKEALMVLAPEAFPREEEMLMVSGYGDGYINIGPTIVRRMMVKLEEMEGTHGKGNICITLGTDGDVHWNPITSHGTKLQKFV